MNRRSRVVASLIAVVYLTGLGAAFAAPAFAAEPISTSISENAPAQLVIVPGVVDSTDQQPLGPNGTRQVGEVPVAERPTDQVNPLILVAGLGVLFASIFAGVMSGSRSHVGRD
jgi:hypothetical protein